MSTFPLDQLDEHLLKQIVKKFTATSAAGFYCSCKGAMDLVDRVKPVWDLPESRLDYIANMTATVGNQGLFLRRGGTSANLPLELCRIETVEVSYCKTDYIKTVVLPEVAAVGCVGRLEIGKMSEGDAQLLIAAAKPETLCFCDNNQDPTSAIFEHIKHIWIYAVKERGESYLRTKNHFELAKNRRSITLDLWDFSIEIIASFIENWLKGQKTGTLEQLTVSNNLRSVDEVRTIRKEMEDLMKSHIKTEEGYIVERGGLDRLRIAVDFNKFQIDFYFS